VQRALDAVKRAASAQENMIHSLIEAVKTYATLGEVCGALKEVWGQYLQPQDFSSPVTYEEAKKITQGYVFGKPVRILLAKAGHDGHTRGLYIFKDLFRAMGAEVIYLGLRCTPYAVAKAAVEEDVDVVGLSALIGFSPGFFQDLKEELRRFGRDDIIIVGGGLMLPEHYRFIREELGIQGIFLPDTPLEDVIEAVKREVDNEST
jgi:methylmalonyl-CoA mutase cobalamin-binding domain/chain